MHAIDDYLADCLAGRLADGTITIYRRHLMRARETVGKPLTEASAHELRAFLVSAQLEPTKYGRLMSAHTLHQIYRALHTFYAWCVRHALRADNPMDGIRRPQLPKRRVPRLRDDDLRALVTAAEQSPTPARDVAMLFVLIDCGLRASELCALNVEDVSLTDRTLTVIGKGNKERVVPFSVATRDKLADCIGVYRWSGPVFRNAQHGTPLTRGGVLKWIKRLGKRAGVKRIYPHLLRHTFARLYLRRGNLRSLQLVLGHAHISTTEIYTELDQTDLRAAHDTASPAIILALGQQASQA